MAARLIKTNPRLPVAKARFLAEHWARPLQPGQQGYALRADPAHKRVNPVPYRVDEALVLLGGDRSADPLGRRPISAMPFMNSPGRRNTVGA